MKEFSSYQLVQTIIANEKSNESILLPAPKVRKLAVKLHGMAIESSFGEISFRKMAYQYPGIVQITEHMVIIQSPSELRAKLEKQLRFVKDDKLERIVWNIWQNL